VTPGRIDHLLDAALRTGAIPAEATPEERAELEVLLAGAKELKLNAATVDAEARTAMPAARARFERHLLEQRIPEPIATKASGPSLFSRLFGGRPMMVATSAAAVGVIVLVALLVLQPFAATETASALTVDDYVQVQGVVSTTENGVVTVQSPELGDLDVAIDESTAVTDEQGVRETAHLRAGELVLVSGIVTQKRAIAATNVAVAKDQATPQAAAKGRIPLLKTLRESLQGSISLFTLSPDGTRARVLVANANAKFLVDVDPEAMDQFLVENPGPIGARVRIVEAPELAPGVFRLEPLKPPADSPTARPGTAQFENVRGVVTARAGNVLTVQTERGPVAVVVRLGTVIRVGPTALTPREVAEGEKAIGMEVSVSGNLETGNSRRLIASLVILLGRPERPAQ